MIGAFVGGLVGTALGWGTITTGTLNLRSIAIATFGAILVLLVARVLRKARD